MIEFDRVTFAFDPIRPVFRELSLTIERGQRVALIGRNGSGKSTLLRLAAGLLKPTAGRIAIDSDDAFRTLFRRNWRQKLGFIFQNPEDQIVAATVEQELAFSGENFGWELERIAAAVADRATRYELTDLRERESLSLSAGEKQRLALGAMTLVNPDIVLLDEPTSYLDQRGRELLVREFFAERGITVVGATQYLEELTMYDRVLMLQDNAIAFDGTVSEFQETHVFQEITAIKANAANRQVQGAEPISALSCVNVDFAYESLLPVFKSLNLTVNLGQITAVCGASGSGKSSLALLLAGVLTPQAGELRYHLSEGRRNSVALVLQFPERNLFADTVAEEIAYGLRNDAVASETIAVRAELALAQVGLEPSVFLTRHPLSLSAGEQRRVAIAAMLALERPILILDEVTAGLDWDGVAQVRHMINDLTTLGKAVVVISHDRDFVDSVADVVFDLSSEP